jgi:hypothetical protein
VLYSVGAFYLLLALVLCCATIITTNKVSLLHRQNAFVHNTFKVMGQVLTLINYVFFIPSLVIFAEIMRCQSILDPSFKGYQCLDNTHLSAIIFSVISALVALTIVIFNNLFVNF